MKELHQWVAWKEVDGRKIPFQSATRRASTTDSETWLSDREAKRLAAQERFDGIGFVFTADDPYFGLDLDGCIDRDTGDIRPWAQDIVDALGTYTERSPSGTGLHAIGKGRLPENVRHKVHLEGEVGGKRAAIEVYDQGRYFTYTGDVVDGRSKVRSCQAALDDLVARYLTRPEADRRASTTLDTAANLSDDEVLARIAGSNRARTYHRLFVAGETLSRHSESESDFELACILASHVGRDVDRIERLMRRSALVRGKWEDHSTYLRSTIEAAIIAVGTRGAVSDAEDEATRFVRFDEVLADPDLMMPPEALVPFAAWTGHLTVLAGREKWAGKSTFLTAGAAALTRARPFLGGAPHRGKVLWVSADQEHWGGMVLRLMRFRGHPGRMYGLYPSPVSPIEGRLAEVEQRVQEVGPDWVIVDTLTSFALVEDPWKPGEWVSAMMRLKEIARRYEAAITVVSHTPKGREEEYFGSIGIGGAADQIVTIQNLTRDVLHPERRLTSIGRLDASDVTVELVDDEYRQKVMPQDGLEQRVLAAVREEPGLSQNGICEIVGRKKKTVIAAIEKLVRDGLLTDTGTSAKHAYDLGDGPVGTPYVVTSEDRAMARAMRRGHAFLLARAS